MALELWAGGVALQELLDTPPAVIQAGYEAKLRAEARTTAAQVQATASAIGGSLNEDGARAMRSHVAALLAISEGREVSPGTGGGDSYTKESAPFL